MALRRFSALCWLAAPLVLLASLARPHSAAAGKKEGPGKLWVYVGTYTGPKSKGIYRLELDLADGKLSPAVLAVETGQPSFLAIHPSGRYLYAVNEQAGFLPKKTGAVSAFAIDAKTGNLTTLNHRSSGGAAPCHLVVDAEGKHVLAANYSGGSVCVLPINANGRLGEATAVVQHQGSSVNKQRQEGPHAHSINLDKANRFAFAADLGLDKVLIYRFDKAKGTLTPNDPPAVALPPGSGPRHFAFHPDGRHAYVINELTSTITALAYDPERGALEPLQTVSTLPSDFKGNTTTAEVQVHPSGKFLYGSNRGHDSIAVFTVDGATGKLTPAGHQGEGIKTPRNFGIDPTGAFLLVANQGAGTVVAFRIDARTGALTPTGSVAEVPTPVCVKMMPAGR
jgi:6-phosphogluconolactonase